MQEEGGGGVSPFECMCVCRFGLPSCLVLCLPALHPSSSSRPSMLPCFPCPSSLRSPSPCSSLSGAAAGRPTTQLCTQLGPKASPTAASPRGCTGGTAPERLDPTNPAATPCSAYDGRPTSGWCWGGFDGGWAQGRPTTCCSTAEDSLSALASMRFLACLRLMAWSRWSVGGGAK
jgi:hypothetical protein